MVKPGVCPDADDGGRTRRRSAAPLALLARRRRGARRRGGGPCGGGRLGRRGAAPVAAAAAALGAGLLALLADLLLAGPRPRLARLPRGRRAGRPTAEQQNAD